MRNKYIASIFPQIRYSYLPFSLSRQGGVRKIARTVRSRHITLLMLKPTNLGPWMKFSLPLDWRNRAARLAFAWARHGGAQRKTDISRPAKDMIRGVKAMGMETCVTLGMLEARQAKALREAGLDYYNHNLDTSPEFYGQIISTRTYQDRLDTLEHVRDAGINVCCGGIVGMGESRRERAGLIAQLANMQPYPESVPINNLVQVDGTPLAGIAPLDPFEFVRTIAIARITMPRAMVRLSAGREKMDEALQALCFAAGANSIFYGDQLLTTSNPQVDADRRLLERLGIRAEGSQPQPMVQTQVCALSCDHVLHQMP